MPKINFENIGDLQDHRVVKGTIKTIDPAADTCTVDVSGAIVEALLFYHCQQDSALRENGAIEGAAAGFGVDDEVVVIRKHDDSKILVVGHIDGIRPCKTAYIIVTFTVYQEEYINESDTIIRIRNRVLLWNAAGSCLGYVPGLTFPCDPLDPLWLAWLSDKSVIGSDLFAGSLRGIWFGGRSGWEVETQPDATEPELNLPEPNLFTEIESGEWFYYSPTEDPYWSVKSYSMHLENSCASPFTSDYAGPVNGVLLENLLPDAPIIYTGFRTSLVHDYLMTGDDLSVGADRYTADTVFTVHSPFGVMKTYTELFRITGGYWGYGPCQYNGPWPWKRMVRPPSQDRGLYERLHLNACCDGVYTDKIMASLFVHQHRNVSFSLPIDYHEKSIYVYYGTSLSSLLDGVAGTHEDRIVSVHAQAKYYEDGITGKDFVEEGRSLSFETAIQNAIEAVYTDLDSEDSQSIWAMEVALKGVE